MEEFYSEAQQIDYGNETDFSDTAEEPTNDTFTDIPSEEPPTASPDEPVPPFPESSDNAENEDTEALPQTEEPAVPSIVVETDLTPVLSRLEQLQETQTLLLKETQNQAKRQNDFFQYSFIVLFMIFCAFVVHLIFSKIQV